MGYAGEMREASALLVLLALACISGFGMGSMEGAEDSIIAMIEDGDATEDRGQTEEMVSTLEGSSVGMDEKAEFDEFTRRHRKRYKDHSEFAKRFGVWKDNLSFVRKWNADGSSAFKVGMNEFADLTDDEFAANYLNPSLHDEYLQSETFKTSLLQENAGTSDSSKEAAGFYDIRWHKNTGKKPRMQDWTKKGAVSEVNNQAKCFACYAFAACGAIEGALVIQGKPLRKLSAQQIVDCSTPSSGFMNHGCKGGTMVKSYKYII